MSKDTRVTIRIPEYLNEKVKQLAEKLNVSNNDVYKILIHSCFKD